MLNKILVVLVVMFLSGCVSTKSVSIDQESSAVMNGKSMAVSASDRPDFAAITAGKAMFALAGAFAMISAGNEIIEKYDIEDPAVFISRELAKDIGVSRSISVALPVVAGNNDDISHLVEVNLDSDYVLDVRTINWSFGYFPTDWDNYRVIYNAKSRLIDVGAKKVIAEAFCSRVPEKSNDAPSRQQLLSNNAGRLKEELSKASDYCIKEMREKLL